MGSISLKYERRASVGLPGLSASLWDGPGVVQLPWNLVFLQYAVEMLEETPMWQRHILLKWKQLMQRVALSFFRASRAVIRAVKQRQRKWRELARRWKRCMIRGNYDRIMLYRMHEDTVNALQRRHYEDIAVFSLHVTYLLRGQVDAEHICRQASAYVLRRSCHERALTNSVKRLMELREEAAEMFRSGPHGSMLSFSDPCLLARSPRSAEAVRSSYGSRSETQTSECANDLVEPSPCSTAVPVELDKISVTSARTWTSFD